MLFSAFALAVDRFVTIGRRTAQFCFDLLMRCLFLNSPFLRPCNNKKGTSYLGRDLETDPDFVSMAFGVATCLETPSNSIKVSRVNGVSAGVPARLRN